MSDLQEMIATTTIKAYNQGLRDERERLTKLVEDYTLKATTADGTTIEGFGLCPSELLAAIKGLK